MKRNQSLADKFYNKIYLWRWTVGFFRGNIEEIIRNKIFDPDIHWLPVELSHRFFADPFFLEKNAGKLLVMVEEFDYKKKSGK